MIFFTQDSWTSLRQRWCSLKRIIIKKPSGICKPTQWAFECFLPCCWFNLPGSSGVCPRQAVILQQQGYVHVCIPTPLCPKEAAFQCIIIFLPCRSRVGAENCSGGTKGSPRVKMKQCVLSLSFSMKSGSLWGTAHENGIVWLSKSCWELCGGNPASLPRRMKSTWADPRRPRWILFCCCLHTAMHYEAQRRAWVVATHPLPLLEYLNELLKNEVTPICCLHCRTRDFAAQWPDPMVH